MKLYSIIGHANTGRSGNVYTSDNNLSLNLGAPGTKNDNYNPEQLFSLGYASCFSQAMFAVTEKNNIKIDKAPIDVLVELHKDESKGFYLMVGIEATINNLDEQTAISIMKQAHAMCPYSKLVKPENFLYVKINGKQI